MTLDLVLFLLALLGQAGDIYTTRQGLALQKNGEQNDVVKWLVFRVAGGNTAIGLTLVKAPIIGIAIIALMKPGWQSTASLALIAVLGIGATIWNYFQILKMKVAA